jgi:hypothetical protein
MSIVKRIAGVFLSNITLLKKRRENTIPGSLPSKTGKMSASRD